MIIDILFEDPPGPDGSLVEIEDENRESVKVGEWLQRDDGWWVLRVSVHESGEYGLQG